MAIRVKIEYFGNSGKLLISHPADPGPIHLAGPNRFEAFFKALELEKKFQKVHPEDVPEAIEEKESYNQYPGNPWRHNVK